jgi:hypothetical protein
MKAVPAMRPPAANPIDFNGKGIFRPFRDLVSARA